MHKLIERNENFNGTTWDYEDGTYLRLIWNWIDWQGPYVDGTIEFRIMGNRKLFNLILAHFSKLNKKSYAEKLLTKGADSLKLEIETHRFKDKWKTGKMTTWTDTITSEKLMVCSCEWYNVGEIHFTVYNKHVYDKLLEFVKEFEPPDII